VAVVVLFGEPAGDAARASALRAQVASELREIAARGAPGAEPDFARLEGLDDVRFACEVAHALRLPGPEKQALLEAADAAERLERAAQTLAFYRALAPSAATGGGATLH
jgi:hypothetical protein